MKVAIAGDWHGNTGWALSVISAAALAGACAIVHTGDFGLWPGDWGERYLDTVDQALDELAMALIFVDGNHEDHGQLATWPRAGTGAHEIRGNIGHLPRGYRWEWDGKTWLALGGAVSPDRAMRTPGHSWWPEEAITDADVQRCIAGGPADVMITHDAPATTGALSGYLASNGFRMSGQLLHECYMSRMRVREVVDAVQPQLLVHGHYHHRYDDQLGDTRIIGLDCDGTSRFDNLILLDTKTLKVVP